LTGAEKRFFKDFFTKLVVKKIIVNLSRSDNVGHQWALK
jgi:hypothetical protein